MDHGGIMKLGSADEVIKVYQEASLDKSPENDQQSQP